MFKNLGLKFVAVCLAVLFWIGIMTLTNEIKYFKEPIPINPFNIGEDLTLASSLGSVQLRLESSQETFNNLSVNDFEAYIDLKGFEAGEHNVPIQVTSKNPKVKVVRFEPDNLSVAIEEITSKVVNVSVEVKGNVAENFESSDSIFELKEAEVKGPKKMIEKVTEVKAIITLKGTEMADFKTEINLFAYDSNQKQLNNIEIIPASLEVSIPVIQIQKFKTVGVRANLEGELGADMYLSKILVSPSAVVIQGDTQELKKVDYVETESIDINGLNHNTLKRVKIKLPANVTTQEITSVLVTLEVANN